MLPLHHSPTPVKILTAEKIISDRFVSVNTYFQKRKGKNLLTENRSYDKLIELVHSDGEMAERLKALVLKTSDTERYRGFESLSLRQP